MSKNRIIPQMFDVRPVDREGNLDWKRISGLGKEAVARRDSSFPNRKSSDAQTSVPVIPSAETSGNIPSVEALTEEKWNIPRGAERRRPRVFVLGKRFESREIPAVSSFKADAGALKNILRSGSKEMIPARISRTRQVFVEKKEAERRERIAREERARTERRLRIEAERTKSLLRAKTERIDQRKRFWRRQSRKFQAGLQNISNRFSAVGELFSRPKDTLISLPDASAVSVAYSGGKRFFGFASAAILIIVILGGAALWERGSRIQGRVLGVSREGIEEVKQALSDLAGRNFEGSATNFNEAYLRFSIAADELNEFGSVLIGATRYFPFLSRLSSGSEAIEAGKYLSQAGKELAQATAVMADFKDQASVGQISLLDFFDRIKPHLELAQSALKQGKESLEGVNADDLPEEQRSKFGHIRSTLPEVIRGIGVFLDNEKTIYDLIGGNGPRRYLFLFQNNQEMRATGGFIGSYGYLELRNGKIAQFYINGIFDPDGQLAEKIVPPGPIQKISAAWSLHDSNWFPDFPVSARKAINFYEKTGGPTVDGVITLTPSVIAELLEVTGPIPMEEYGTVLTSENFIRETQQEVESDYDKEENKPKQILSDLAPLLLEKLFRQPDLPTAVRTFDVFLKALGEKHILAYSSNPELEELIRQQGWSGEVRETGKDYLSVINTNINGFKTDGVINERIAHRAEIQEDGSVIDTVSVTRRHKGGNTGYEWWDKVNADYLRIYVPLGSEFLGVEGQTREFTEAPLDYEALRFKRDAQVEAEENGTRIDELSGTRIYEDAGKTVFANWTYVSPQEEMTITYRYRLPFRVELDREESPADAYSLLVQKQSGSIGSAFFSELSFPRRYEVAWRTPDDLQAGNNLLRLEAELTTDYFWGAAFTERNLIINR